MAYIIGPDGTAKDIDGRTIFFSFQQFKDEICQNGHCFVCGAAPNETFNNEHVFPNWVLRHCGTHNEMLTLPNGVGVKYSTYKIPCCQDCNSLLADVYEAPISNAVCGGYDSTVSYIKEGGLDRLKAWLSLIFLKVHLKDFKNRISLDNRQDMGVIGDEYDLSDLHHVHAIARAATAGIEIDEQVFGTLLMLQVDPTTMSTPFDYCNILAGRTLLLQVQDVALIYVIDDCGATADMLSDQLKTLPDPVSEIQLREVYARYLSANIHIKNRPIFRTEFSGLKGKPRIRVELPNLEIHDYEPSVFGRMFVGALGNLSESIEVDGQKGDAAIKIIATGQVSFLFGKNGEVINQKPT